MGWGIEMSDLVKRLREGREGWLANGLSSEAADKIERLERGLADDTAGLRLYAKAAEHAEAQLADLQAKLADWQYHQQYRYIGIDGKPVLARDLEDRALNAEARIDQLELDIELLKSVVIKQQDSKEEFKLQLAAEKALADMLYRDGDWDNGQQADWELSAAAYRKARGL